MSKELSADYLNRMSTQVHSSVRAVRDAVRRLARDVHKGTEPQSVKQPIAPGTVRRGSWRLASRHESSRLGAARHTGHVRAVSPDFDRHMREQVVLLMDAFAQNARRNALIPDLRAQLTEVVAEGGQQFEAVGKASSTTLFHAVRDLMAEGLVVRDDKGYQLSESGKATAATIRGRDPDSFEMADAAAKVILT